MADRKCNRTACQTTASSYWHWNTVTRAWYCDECAVRINANYPPQVPKLCVHEFDLPGEKPVLDHIPFGGSRPHTDREQVMLAVESMRIFHLNPDGGEVYQAINTLGVERDGFRRVLAELVAAKDEKDANGDSEKYRAMKEGLWDRARRTLTFFAESTPEVLVLERTTEPA